MGESQISANLGPLTGIKVVDLTRYLAGPVCTRILGDMGAEIIKIEDPREGDHARTSPPAVSDIGGYFPAQNRNKKGITLNLLTDKGKDIFRRFIVWGDVLAENFRPGFMKRIGFDYPAVQKINPRMVMVSLSAFGQTGPKAQRAGFDMVGQAEGGTLKSAGPGEPPQRLGGAGADPSTGVFGALGVSMALYNRWITGHGQHIDVNLMETMAFFSSGGMVSFARGQDAEEIQAEPKGIFKTKDGRYIIIYAQDDHHWPLMAGIIGRPELAHAPGYRTRPERNARADELVALMSAWVALHTIDEVEEAVGAAALPYGKVQTPADFLKDPHLNARGMIQEVDHYGEVLPLYSPYPKLSDTPGAIRMPCPHLGQHNEEIYGGLLGFSKKELAVLKSEGVI